MLLGAL